MRRARALPLLAFGLLPLLAGCVVHVDSGGFSARKEQRFRVDGRPTVDLATFDGAIEVRAWDRDEVVVRVESRASSRPLLESIDVLMTQRGRRIEVAASAPDKDGWQWRGGGISRTAHVTASVPVGSEVKLRSGDGSVRVERVRGVIDARTEDGRIVMREVGGEIVADTGDGSVQMEDVDGRCTVSTRDGSVLVSGRLRGRLRATSGDGTITIRAADASLVTGDWDIETGDGGVLVTLPDQLDATLDFQTSDGRISLNGFPEFPVERLGAGGRLTGVLGTGEGRLKIRTGDGSITMKRSFVPPPPAPPAPPAPPVAPTP